MLCIDAVVIVVITRMFEKAIFYMVALKVADVLDLSQAVHLAQDVLKKFLGRNTTDLP